MNRSGERGLGGQVVVRLSSSVIRLFMTRMRVKQKQVCENRIQIDHFGFQRSNVKVPEVSGSQLFLTGSEI